jgi:hypothetical protein
MMKSVKSLIVEEESVKSLIVEEEKETVYIDLNVLNEGLFSTFLSAIGGWLMGKHSQKVVIKGKEDQIELLKSYLVSMKKNQHDKDELINKLIAIKANSRNVNDMRSQFEDATGIRLPD